jgi:hypothetical protein
MRIIRALSQQLDATIEVRRLDLGTEFVVTVPCRLSANHRTAPNPG